MSPLARLLLALVQGYRRGVSPLLGPHCRFAPTCSAYAAEALARHGALAGGWLAIRRLGRCHPFCAGGHDPVPVVRLVSTTPFLRSRASRRREGERSVGAGCPPGPPGALS